MTDEIPIGPNPCSYCGGEYGEHDEDCRKPKPPTTDPVAPTFYQPWEVAKLIEEGPDPQDKAAFAIYMTDHMNRALSKGNNLGIRYAFEESSTEIINLRKALEKARAEGRGE